MLQDKKKLIIIAVTVVILLATLIMLIPKNNNSSVVGTWYSDRDNMEILQLTKDGTYKGGGWLNSGIYAVDKDVITLSGTLDSTTQLVIVKEKESTKLVYENGHLTFSYFTTAEQAQASIKKKATDKELAEAERLKLEAEQSAAAEKAAADQKDKDIQNLQAQLTGYWYPREGYPVMFTAEGGFTYYLQGEEMQGQYKIIDDHTVEITRPDGNADNHFISIIDGTMTLAGGSTSNYNKASLIALDLKLLEGEWKSSTTNIFTADGKFIEKSLVPGVLDDKEYQFTILDDSTIITTDSTGTTTTRKAFLSETDKEYQLIMSKTTAGINNGILMTREKGGATSSTSKNYDSEWDEYFQTVEDTLIGTWKGLLSMEALEPDYWVYTFSEDGTYTFTNNEVSESGNYSVTHDPDGPRYHSSLILVSNGQTQTVQFYLSGEEYNTLNTDQTGPTYKKDF